MEEVGASGIQPSGSKPVASADVRGRERPDQQRWVRATGRREE
jgi:hypothetical protein